MVYYLCDFVQCALRWGPFSPVAIWAACLQRKPIIIRPKKLQQGPPALRPGGAVPSAAATKLSQREPSAYKMY
jgi:hypothetical protein